MDLNEVLVFTRVVQAGSFTAAARLLAMPKSSVSKKVADLEDRIGVRLLQRTTRRLGLTDAGRVYFERCARIVSDLEDADAAVGHLQATPRGLLRVTAPLSFGFLGRIAATFLDAHPEVRVEVACTDRVVDLVDEGFDVAIRAGALADSSLHARRLALLRSVVVASPAYLREHGTPRAPDDLAAYACLAFSGSRTPTLWSLRTGRHVQDVRVAVRMTANDLDLVLDAARAGAGLAMAADFLVADDLAAGRLLRVLPGWASTETPVHAVYPTSRHLSPKVIAFVEALQQRFGGR